MARRDWLATCLTVAAVSTAGLAVPVADGPDGRVPGATPPPMPGTIRAAATAAAATGRGHQADPRGQRPPGPPAVQAREQVRARLDGGELAAQLVTQLVRELVLSEHGKPPARRGYRPRRCR